MTKPKPPFAEVRRTEGGWQILVGGQPLAHDPWWPTPDLPNELVPAINAAHESAVAAREANLVAVLRRCEWSAALQDEPYRGCPACGVEREFHPSNQKPHQPDCWLAAALEGAGPDLVAEPRAQVEALRADKGPWMVLADLANSGGLASERAGEVMRALGMRPDVSDMELLAEVRRRGLGQIERRVCRERGCNRLAVANDCCDAHAIHVYAGAGSP